jgi:hypothetical protein
VSGVNSGGMGGVIGLWSLYYPEFETIPNGMIAVVSVHTVSISLCIYSTALI